MHLGYDKNNTVICDFETKYGERENLLHMDLWMAWLESK